MKRRRGSQRARDQAQYLGREVLLARTRLGWSRADASSRAGVSRSTWERVERGSTAPTIATACAVTDAVGLDLVSRTYPGAGPTLHDRGQMIIAAHLSELAHSSWRTSLEVTAGTHGEAIDQIFWGPDEILGVEIIRHLRDYQAQYRAASLKRDWLANQHSRPVRLILAIEDLRSNRAAAAPYMRLMSTSLPAGSRQILDALRTGTAVGSDGVLWVRRPSTGERRTLDRALPDL
jgi:transcriptional regulator with XRE-family HTH domain